MADNNEPMKPEVMAAITAVVALVVRRPFQIKSVHPVRPPSQSLWATYGRSMVQSSHYPRGGNR